MKKIPKSIYLLLPLIIIIVIISLKNSNTNIAMEKIRIENLSSTNIFLGHRSVGENILGGIKRILRTNNYDDIKIKKVNKIDEINGNYFVDENIGYNGDPKSKFDAFAKIVKDLASNKKLNMAMMKLCYADITNESDVNEIFLDYANIIDSLKNEFPNIEIIHFTVPLTAKLSFYRKIKSFIKGTLNNNSLSNLSREKYNKLIRSYYPSEQIFDLAKIESTYPDGSLNLDKINGENYYSLVEAYTTDGGHLNDEGQILAGMKLLKFLENHISKIPQKNMSNIK